MDANNITIKNIESSEFEGLLGLANNLGVDIDFHEGTLIDNYILSDAEKIQVNGNRAKYIIGQETVKNSWESHYTVIMTNDVNQMNEYAELFDKDNTQQLMGE